VSLGLAGACEGQNERMEKVLKLIAVSKVTLLHTSTRLCAYKLGWMLTVCTMQICRSNADGDPFAYAMRIVGRSKQLFFQAQRK
jgi:hypothetical protein